MNGKNQNQSRQDSEELLVTSSTSSSSANLVESRATVSTPSSSPTTTIRITDPSLIAAALIRAPTSSTGGSICQIVTSSTGNNSNPASNLDEDDDDDPDVTIVDAELNLIGLDLLPSVSNDSSKIPAASTPEMGGPSSNNEGETCVVLPSSSSYLEQRNDNNKNMLLTTRNAESDSKIESSVPTVSSVVSAPTTRSRRKLLNSEAASTTALGLNHSISLNNSKCINLEVKNHQSTKKKSAATTSSINSLSHSNDTPKVAAPSIGGKNLGTLKNSEDSIVAGSSSSKRNCLVANEDELTESQSDCDETSYCKSTTNCSVVVNDDAFAADNRKVEPLKINLNRDIVKTKITIKPIIKPPSAETEQFVPKLTIKSSTSICTDSKSTPNCVDQQQQQQHHEPHIVPKLTIRSSDCNSSNITNSDVKHSVVPKLTIKMEGSMNCVNELNDSSSSSPSSSPPQPPLPKLTIKTTGDITESTITSCVSSSSLSTSSSPSSLTKPTVPKLTIKAIPKSLSSSSASSNNDESFPMFTISSVAPLTPSQSSPSRLAAISDHSDTAVDVAHANSPIPKLTIKTVQDPESNTANQTVPRLKIRTKQEQEVLTNDAHTITTSPTIPKFTIKSVQENEQSIPKLTISVNDRIEASSSSSSSSSSNEAVPKLTVVRHAEQGDGERVPKLTISLQESPKVKSLQSQDSEIAEKHEKVPKITLKTVSEQDIDGSDKVPKLTIKTVSSIETESTEKVPKITIKTVSEQKTETTEKLPKLTIKTVSEQESDSEKSDKVPKLTIRTMPEDKADNIPKLTIAPTIEFDEESHKSEKIPKLTIRTVPSDLELEGVFKSEKFQKLTIKSAVEPDDADKVPKITIKSIPDHNEPDKVPKLTIKTVVENTDVEKVPKLTIKSVSDSVESTEQIPKLTIKQIAGPDSKEKVPKLTIRHVQESEENERTTLVVSTVTEQFDNCGRIPKLTIKPIPETDDDKLCKQQSSVEDNIKIPKFKIKNIADFSPTSTSSTDKLPKLTIKPIMGTDTDEPVEKKSKLLINQSTTNCESSEKVPKLTIKQITNNFDDPSVSCSTPKVPKLIINNHTIRPGRHLKRLKTNEPLGTPTNNDIKITLTQNKTLEKDSAMEGSSKKSKNDPGDAADSTAMEIDQELRAAEVSIAIDIDTDTNSKNDLIAKIEHNSIEDANSVQLKNDRAKAHQILESTKATTSIDRELEIISSKSNAAANRKMSTTSQRSNMEIDGDLSDDAINDLVDILNDELNAAEGLKRVPDSNATCSENFQSDRSKQQPAKISNNDRNRVDVKSRKTNILADTISLDSDEDDIVDQLAELLNENDDMDEIAEQILQDSKNMMNDAKNEQITSELEARTTKVITELGKNDERELIGVENDTPSSSGQDSSKDDAIELQRRQVITNANSPNNSSEALGHSHSDLNYNNRPKDNYLQSDNIESSVLHSLLSQKVRSDPTSSGASSTATDSRNTRDLNATKNSSDAKHSRGNNALAEMDLSLVDAMKSIVDGGIIGVVDNLTIATLESKSKLKLKRAINDDGVFHLMPKRPRSHLLNSIADQVTNENSFDSDIMAVQENNCPSSVVNKTPSNIVDLENSSLTGDETFRTLTELRTMNNVLDENEEVSVSSKEQDDNNTNLRGILTRLQNQHCDSSQTSQQSFKSNSNKANHKSAEPEISVVLSTPPHSNSLKLSHNILLINEESGSDCMIVEEDPLMILQNSVDALTDKKNHNENDSDLDISSSFQTLSESVEITTPPVKRPRGRPRKDGQPAGSVKKKEDLAAKRKFKGVLMGSHNSMVERNKVSPAIESSVVATPPIITASIPLFEKPEPTTPVKAPEVPSPDSITPVPVTPPKTVGRRGRGTGRGRGRGASRIARARCVGGLSHTPEKKKDGEFFTPDRRKKTEIKTPALQVFEEDTRMSADSFTTPVRQTEIVNNINPDENTQSSILSISSVLDGSSNTATAPTTEKKRRAKMEVFAPEGKTEYTVDMIAEYDWPPPKGCCPARNRDTFMIQEQIAQYLGIKSFKRKYPDLPRRQVDMEERNYLQEKGLVTEKMCDLGITAVWASDVLDIMYSDFYEKYEEYKTYLREKQLRDIEAKQRALAAEAVDKSLQARERALESASKWNCNFNKARKEDRRLCLDLQNLVINLPAAVGQKLSRPIETQNFRQSSDYPIALVPGQFAENYRVYSARELRCYPINTILDPFDDRLRPKVEHNDDGDSSNESDCDTNSESSSEGSDSDTSSSSDSDSDRNTSSEDDDNDEEDKPPDTNKNKCFVCHQPENKNLNGFPEVFICCVTCRKRTHPSCIDMPTRMVTRVRNYNWQCADCKCCIKCKRKQDESKMLYCEQCDRGFHIYCIQIKTVPDGRWHCERCAICMRCGSSKAEGNLPPPPLQPYQKPSRKKAKWVNEYRVDHITKLREHSSILCVPCARLKTKQRTTS